MNERTADTERVERIRAEMDAGGFDLLVCTLSTNVLLLTGYWPVVGSSIALFTRDGQVHLLAPEDEKFLADESRADTLKTFSGGSLDKLVRAIESVRKPLREVLTGFGTVAPVIGFENGASFQSASYAAMHLYGASLLDLFRWILPKAKFRPCDELLDRLRSRLTAVELKRLRSSCGIVQGAFRSAVKELRTSLSERAAAELFRSGLFEIEIPGVRRVNGFAWCMSGPNAARAFASYQISTHRRLEQGDLVLIHCNSGADGFWTDVTRTFCLGAPDERHRRMYDAVTAASRAAIESVRPGAKGCDVDRAAREVMKSHGFGDEFKHPTGHGVGFAAINHDALPRMHPVSEDVLETGMVFNIEPGIYIEGVGGMRHCDMVAVTESGAELLTPFLSGPGELVL